MKKYVAGLLTGILIMSTMMVFAESTQTIQAIFGRVKLVVDGKALPDETLLYDGTTYVPLRAVAEILGIQVDWDSDSQIASLTSSVRTVQVPMATPMPIAVAPTPSPTSEPLSKNTEIAFYPENQSIPDFGKAFGIPVANILTDESAVYYLYDKVYTDEIPYSGTAFSKFVEEYGFEFIEFGEPRNYQDFGLLVFAFYRNENGNVVAFGSSSTYSVVAFTI